MMIFNKLKSNRGGLLSMNTFLLTSVKENIGLFYAEASLGDPDTVAVLFQIDVNPLESSVTPYANIEHLNVFEGTEKEYLFSMGTAFRIRSIQKANENIWRINLNLTKTDDKQLEKLARYKR
ncbi:hypothetical protein I4U23_012656 [Adineta vaga]|nr:hypothetical protein I4U23_012656 [Adineta vaga]